ncbi:hypothetical protein MNBD_BACTEROID05-8 [hydrothermal vent metagenome]|uniref:Uncharacterized protein n=1 Tax=hydrothermal vent metagenome TaxID=652676 RepID=A0A3B0U0V4_9ZZZZ
MSKKKKNWIAVGLLSFFVLSVPLSNCTYAQTKRKGYRELDHLISYGLRPDIRELLNLNARIHFYENRKTASCFLGYTDDEASGRVVILKPGILKLVQREPKITALTLSGYTDNFCDGCPERIEFKDNVLKDLSKSTRLTSLYFTEIDFRDAKRYKYIQPLKNLQWLVFKNCAVSIHKLITLTGPYPNMKELYVRQGYAIPFDRRKVPDVSKIELITEKAMLKFVKASPNLEVLTLGSDLTTRIEYKAVLALAKLKKLKKLALYGGTYGYFPFGRYPPEIIKQHKILYKYLKKELPDCKEIRVGPGVIDWPGMGLPKPVPRKCPLCH